MRVVCVVKGRRGEGIVRELGDDVVGIVKGEGALGSFYEGEYCGGDRDEYEVGGGSVNDEGVKRWLREKEADVVVVGGCGEVWEEEVLDIPRYGFVGVHGGKLPEFRGSSPLNWSLIRGCYAYWLTVMEVGVRLDSGKVLEERKYGIGVEDRISDLHERAEEVFPEMVKSVLGKIERGELELRGGEGFVGEGRYLPLRFPGDGRIDWGRMGSWDVHNMVRGLSEPYPCARVMWGGREWRLVGSRMMKTDFQGGAGRIYRKEEGWLQVGTREGGVWIRGEEGLYEGVKRYDEFEG